MKPKAIETFLCDLLPHEANVAVELVGSPGVGKTAVVTQVFERLEWPMFVFYGVNKEVVDAAGLPYLDDKKVTRWGLPSFLADLPQDRPFGLLLDELNQCDMAMQKVLSRAFHERCFGEHPLPPQCRIIATGNRTSDRAGANRLFTHTKNRLCIVDFDADLDNWMDWALSKGNIHPHITGYLRFDNGAFNAFDPVKEGQNATPRSWTMLSTVLPYVQEHLLLQVAAGIVGQDHAVKFKAHVELADKCPAADDILKDPKKCKVPDEPHILYAVASSIVHKMKDAEQPKMRAAWQYLLRMPNEFSVLTAKDCQRANGKFVDTKAFPEAQEFLKKHMSVLIGD